MKLFVIRPAHHRRFFVFLGCPDWVTFKTNLVVLILFPPVTVNYSFLAINDGYSHLISATVHSEFSVCAL